MHPYRDPPARRPAKKLEGLPSEEWFLIGLLVVLGAVVFFAGILTGSPVDGQTTIGLFGLVLGVWCGLRGIPWVRRRRAERSGRLHGDRDTDRAPPP